MGWNYDVIMMIYFLKSIGDRGKISRYKLLLGFMQIHDFVDRTNN